MSGEVALALSLLGAFAATPTVAALARNQGFTDPRPGAPVPERKRDQPPRPIAGGAVLFAAVLLSAGSGALGAGGGLVLSFLLAFGVGTLDDRLPRGLPPLAKLLGQGVAAAPLGVELGLALAGGGAVGAALGVLAVVAAMNLLNTWDHSDGFVAVAFGPGLLLASPGAAGALLGFLPHNALLPARANRGRPLLGDGGSHALGVLVAAAPVAWPLLALPALDLARVVVARLRAGQAPWVADRRHLGHVLEARFPRVGPRLLVVAALAAPGVAASLWLSARALAAASVPI